MLAIVKCNLSILTCHMKKYKLKYSFHPHTHIDVYCFSIFGLNIHLQPNEICLTNVFDSFIRVIKLDVFKYTSFAMFGTHVLTKKILF